MRVLLTGATGFVGSGVLRALRGRGHEVVAAVRSEESARAVADAGATALTLDLTDTSAVADALGGVDAAVHAASSSEHQALDAAFIDAIVDTWAGTDKPVVLTSGVWKHGAGADLTERSPLDAPALVGWRPASDARLLAADVAATVISPGVVYGHGRGVPGLIVGAPRVTGADGGDALLLVGDGSQHWCTVHVDDLADLYVLALEGRARGPLLGVSGTNPTVRELTEAASRAAGLGGAVVAETPAETAARFGEAFAEALLLDQQGSARGAAYLGWTPRHPRLVDEIESGSYAPDAALAG